MKIICIAGLIGSGKNAVSDHISQKYGYKVIDYAEILRDICRKEGMEVTRDNLQNLRLKYGNTFLAEEAVKRI
ncbi:MAG: dephospho-CoA kinase, partial [Candidatus Aenigmarchaeota archaeon]|nr:dephospho-CoA kinase [Candidatus Aenigmarchaeota archaeon]